jgi:hypothetical protein
MKRALYRNQDGAIMVIGVFMAIALCGLLFYVAGLGQIVFRRERMQDAADAVALATAIGHARGMNLIVFINLVMAALVAILLALKLIELLLTGLMLVLAAISWLVPPAAAAIPIVNEARTFVKDVHDAARDIVDNILIGLNTAERAIAAITPAEAALVSAIKVKDNYGKLIDVAVGIPTRITLPVENDKYNTLCDRAEEVLMGLITWATGGLPFIGKVIEMATGALLTGVKLAFCYEDSNYPPPSTPMDITRMLPMDPDPGGQCEDDRSHLKEPSKACQDWEEVLRQRHPEDDGDCVDPQTDTQRARICGSALVGARLRCQPGVEKNVTSYSWSEQNLDETVVFDPTSWTWRTTKFEYVDPARPVMHNTSSYGDAKASFEQAQADAQNGNATFEQAEAQQSRNADKGVPCDDGNLRYSETAQPELLWSAWNHQPTWDEFPDVTRPVCDKRLKAYKEGLPNGGEVPPETADRRLPPGFNPGPYTLRYPTVKQVYGCTQKATIQMTFPSDWTSATAASGGDDKAPQKMEEDVLLGSETFQIRGIAVSGQGRPVQIERGLQHGAFERNVQPESWVGAASVTGKVAVAQAEYYFNHNGTEKKEPKDWMWSMDWRARLVRFRMPSSEDEQQNDGQQGGDMSLSSLSSGSSSLNIDISNVAELPDGYPSLDSLDQLIVH